MDGAGTILARTSNEHIRKSSERQNDKWKNSEHSKPITRLLKVIIMKNVYI